MFNKKEILDCVRAVLGNDIEGLFVDSSVISGDAPDDYEIMSNLKKNIEADLSSTKDYNIYIGATKVVIAPRGSSYVIKIPFTGTYAVKRWTDDETRIPFESREYYYNGGIHSDVCDEENANWENASDELKQIMLYNEFFDWVDKVPVYIQRRIDSTFWDIDDERDFGLSNPTKRIAKFINNRLCKSYYNSIANDFVAILVQTYGAAAAERICFEIGETIDDFHQGNYGVDKFNRCCIIDTAGYDICNWEGSFDEQYR